MANVPETAQFDAGVYQIETTDQVIGGASGIANLQAKALANRTAYLKSITDLLVSAAHGQCRLAAVSSTSLKLAPFGGRNININGVVQQIPSAGVTISNSGLAANTTYFVYAYMNGSTMTLELSTTGHTTSTGGIEVKTGDATRTLVGAVATNASSQFQDGNGVLGVLSYFNRRRKTVSSYFTANRTVSSTTAAEFAGEIRIYFIAWPDDYARARANGGVWTATSGPGYAYIGVDTNSQSDSGGGVNQTSQVPFSAEWCSGVSEGVAHFATLYGIAASGGSITLSGNPTQEAGQRTSLTVEVMG